MTANVLSNNQQQTLAPDIECNAADKMMKPSTNTDKIRTTKRKKKTEQLILFCNGVHHLVEIPTDDLQRPLRTTKN
jgi:hypothetical protein